jgi:hypothetical protein
MKHKTVWVVLLFILAAALTLGFSATGIDWLPVQEMVTALTWVAGAYLGIDQLSGFLASRKLPPGAKYTGNQGKLQFITIAVVLLMIEGVIVQGLSPGVRIPLADLVMLAGLVSALYAGGNKALNIAENMGTNDTGSTLGAKT